MEWYNLPRVTSWRNENKTQEKMRGAKYAVRIRIILAVVLLVITLYEYTIEYVSTREWLVASGCRRAVAVRGPRSPSFTSYFREPLFTTAAFAELDSGHNLATTR